MLKAFLWALRNCFLKNSVRTKLVDDYVFCETNKCINMYTYIVSSIYYCSQHLLILLRTIKEHLNDYCLWNVQISPRSQINYFWSCGWASSHHIYWITTDVLVFGDLEIVWSVLEHPISILWKCYIIPHFALWIFPIKWSSNWSTTPLPSPPPWAFSV